MRDRGSMHYRRKCTQYEEGHNTREYNCHENITAGRDQVFEHQHDASADQDTGAITKNLTTHFTDGPVIADDCALRQAHAD